MSDTTYAVGMDQAGETGAGMTRSRRLFVVLAVVSVGVLLVSGAVGSGLDWAVAQQFMIGWERNVAVWFASMVILGAMLAACTSARVLWVSRRPGWIALAALAVVLGLLAVDELGSLHERLDLDIEGIPIPWFLQRELLAVFGMSLLGLAVFGMWRQRGAMGRAWLGTAVGFGLLGSVYAQEVLEHLVSWPQWAVPLRLMLEEGTELLGTLVLVATLVRLRQRVVPDAAARLRADRGAARLGMWGLLVVTLPLIVMQYKMPPSWDRVGFGMPGQVPAVLLMGVAACCCGSRWLSSRSGRAGWAVLTVAFVVGSVEAEAATRSLFFELPGERFRLDHTVMLVSALVAVAAAMLRSRAWLGLAVVGGGLAAFLTLDFMQPVAQALGAMFGAAGVWLASGALLEDEAERAAESADIAKQRSAGPAAEGA